MTSSTGTSDRPHRTLPICRGTLAAGALRPNELVDRAEPASGRRERRRLARASSHLPRSVRPCSGGEPGGRDGNGGGRACGDLFIPETPTTDCLPDTVPGARPI